MEIAQIYDKANHAGAQSVNALSDVSIQFIVEADDTFDFSFLEEEKQEFALLQRLSDDMPLFRVICTNNFFRDENGRTFDKEDFNGNQPVLICGNKAEEIVDVDPLIYNGTEYRKIGVVQNDGTIATEYGVFIAGNGIEYYPGEELILEGANKKSVKQVFSQITAWAEKQGYTMKILDKIESQVNDIYNVSENGLKIMLLSILTLCSSIVIIIYFWLGQYDEIRKVYFLTGMRNVDLKIYMDYTKVFVLAYICIILTSKGSSWMIKGYVFLFLYTIMTAVLTGYLILRRKGVNIDEEDMEGNCF